MNDDPLAKFQAVLPDERVIAVCDFSPGPSWGFNGVKTLVLTDRFLHTFQRGAALTASRDLDRTARVSTPLTSVHSVATKRRRGLLGGGGALTINVSTDHGRKIFTTKFVDEGAYLADQLARPATTVADELAKLAQLRDSGALTEEEFAAQKAKLLG